MNANSVVPDSPHASLPASFTAPPGKPRKHRRPPVSCIQCRHRKVKCDRNSPCQRCTRKMIVCAYEPELPVSSKPSNSVTNTIRNHTSPEVTSTKKHDAATVREPMRSNDPLTPSTIASVYSGLNSLSPLPVVASV
jgi:hypothetical protein